MVVVMLRAATLKRRSGLSARDQKIGLRAGWVVVLATALVIAAAGATLTIRRLADARTVVPSTVTIDGLTATLEAAGWLFMDDSHHDDQGGYQMPAQMMPGAPTGDNRRFGVPLTLVNTDDEVRGFNLPAEFFLRGGPQDVPRQLHSDTFGRLARLMPGSAVDGVLYFDTVVPGPSDPPLYLVWNRAGKTVPLSIPLLAGDAHPHR
jgi:hypothetical protein